MFTLIVHLKERVIHFPLPAELVEVTAGSLPENSIYLPYKGISRYHFAIRRKASDWVLSDRGSTNGTYLNGEMITQEKKIKAGDIILAGVVQVNVEASLKEMEPIAILSEPSKTDRLKTEQVSALNLDSKENFFSFPKLVPPDGVILGKSPEMLEIYEKLNAILESDVNIFL